MGKRILAGLATVAAVLIVVFGIWFLQLTAPVEVSDAPPSAPTLEAPTATATRPAPTSEPTTVAPSRTSAGAATSTLAPAAATATTAPAATLYRIDAAQSQAAYHVEETFFDRNNLLIVAVGTTRAVAGDILVDPGDLGASRVGEIVVDISQFRSDEPSRDNAIRREWLESARYPLATFTNAGLHDLPAAWEIGQTLSFSMTGDMTVRTVTRPVTWAVDATVEPDALRARASTRIKMTDFGFDPPRLATLAVEDDVILVLDLVAPAVEAPAATPTTAASPTAQATAPSANARSCNATPTESGRPNYQPNAPERASVGTGHILHGTISSSRGCAPLAGARLELWLTNPQGAYDPDHRATVFANESGAFRFESNMPGAYGGGSPHIHMVASAPGHRDVVTTLILMGTETESSFDLVLPPD